MAVNIRSVLEYVPYFRGRLFVVHIDAELLHADELVDTLLDADALHEIGVRLVLVAEGNTAAQLSLRAATCEMHAAEAELPLSAGEAAICRIREITERRQVAIVASGATGRFDEGSVQLASALNADKYICLQVGQVPCREGQPIFAIPESEVAACTDCTHPEQLRAAAEVCRRGIQRVHLLNGMKRGVLLDELFSEEGVGTMVHSDSYRDIRPLQEDDIPELLSMIARCVVDSKLVQRTYESIRDNIHSYYVYTLDDTIVGCVALYPYPENSCAELGCLFIKKNYEGHGYGRAMCHFVEERAKKQGFSWIFAISQSAVDYFRHRLKYASLPRSVLPEARRQALESSGRHSEVFGRHL
ncbi:MAG: GNAT family N-acetyltransferase [Akkermansiaceae bacterium]|nr:GNAT family N-acetyltransferase [Akkermansiaceae bacterium]